MWCHCQVVNQVADFNILCFCTNQCPTSHSQSKGKGVTFLYILHWSSHYPDDIFVAALLLYCGKPCGKQIL